MAATPRKLSARRAPSVKFAAGGRCANSECGFVLKLAQARGLLSGKTVGVDSMLIEANAVLKSTVRKESGEDWRANLRCLAAAEGLDLKMRVDLTRSVVMSVRKGPA